jgi:hypothetical protein
MGLYGIAQGSDHFFLKKMVSPLGYPGIGPSGLNDDFGMQ